MNTQNFFFKKVCLLLTLLIGLGILPKFGSAKKKPKKPTKVVLLIGDGMGLAQISSVMVGYTGQNAFERFEVIGLSKTSSADNYVTDSGAGATVFSIGKKTYNGAIGVDSAGKEHRNLFELVKDKGWGTGVVVTSSITHATPAAFYAHVASRKSEDEIAEFLVRKSCDIAIGGGKKFFTDRKDKRNLFSELNELGYKIAADTNLLFIDSKKLIYTLADNGMKKMQEGRGDYLKKATQMAQSNLNKYYENYFLMVEGSQIDWGGHENDFTYMQQELLDFNSVLNQVLDEAKKDGNTLVIVTADHETGGLSMLENKSNTDTFTVNYASKGHSGIMVPVFAYGPGAEDFSGIYENTAIFDKLKKLMIKDGATKYRN
ncbi:MAG: alkaline phosphatase [Bacteroidetes bacterium B1(2017)]|nr:MAG: alkaline phosphatase [Bacteroidetes bacterium B1(2017)]